MNIGDNLSLFLPTTKFHCFSFFNTDVLFLLPRTILIAFTVNANFEQRNMENQIAPRFQLTIETVALAAVKLLPNVYQHIKRWWNGEIDGTWCAKYVIADTAAIFGGLAGAALGTAIGLLLGPLGVIILGAVGGFAGGAGAKALTSRITRHIFGLPKSEAVSNAYRYLGVPVNASNIEVNRAYHRLCLIHHPDRGGNIEEFFVLQLHMAVIRQARGEY